MRGWLLVTVPVLCGCFWTPPRPVADDATTGSDDASVTAEDAADGPQIITCGLDVVVDEPFTTSGAAACGAWGTPSGTVMRLGGQLAVTPPANDVNESYCVTADHTLAGIVTLELASVPDEADGDYQFLQISASTGHSMLVQIYRNGGVRKLSATCDATVPVASTYSATDHRWLRVTVDTGVNPVVLVASSSPDGVGFTQVIGAPCSLGAAAPVTGRVRFGAGTEAARMAPATTSFDNFSIGCP